MLYRKFVKIFYYVYPIHISIVLLANPMILTHHIFLANY